MFEEFINKAGDGAGNLNEKIHTKIADAEAKILKDGWKGRYLIMRKRSGQGWFMSAMGFLLASVFAQRLEYRGLIVYGLFFFSLCSAYLMYQDHKRYREDKA